MGSEKSLFLIMGAVVVFLILGVIIFGPRASSPSTNATDSASLTPSDLVTNESFFDFGTISMKNGKVSHKFKVKNPLSQTVTATKLYTSCMCTEASLIKGESRKGPFGMQGHGFVPSISENFNSGEEGEVEVTFDPNAHGPAGVGLIEREVFLEQTGGKIAKINIKAMVTP